MKKLALVALSALTLTSFANANNDALWGALIGGVIGNQVGSSDHNQYVGALIGSILMGSGSESNHYRTYNHGNQRYYSERSYVPQGGYYTYVTNRVYVDPVYGYTDCGQRVLVKNGYWKTVTQKVWVPHR
jgi:uncharacterized protein YcfJ